MTNLHVGYVLKVYPRLSETFIVNEILELERLGARVTIFSLKTPRDGRFHAKLAKVRAEVVYLPDMTPSDMLGFVMENREELEPIRDRLGRILWDMIRQENRQGIKLLGKALALTLSLRHRGIDHLHAHFGTNATETAMLTSRLSGITYSFTAHAKDIYHENVDTDLLAERIRRARFVVTVCDANKEYLENINRSNTEIHRVYNGLDMDEFQPVPGEKNGELFNMIVVTRLVPKKGIDTLIEACGILKKKGLDYRCTVIGDGPERLALERLITENDLSSRVELAGALPDRRVREAMRKADLFTLPARVAPDGNKDALPTVLLEALALGLPTVSTPICGIGEILDEGRVGVLVPPDRPDILADSVARLAGDREERGRMSWAGRERALELFDISRNVPAILEHFRSAIRADGKQAETGKDPSRTTSHAPGLS